MDSHSIWREIVKASSTAASDTKFIECLALQIQHLIQELKVLIDNACALCPDEDTKEANLLNLDKFLYRLLEIEEGKSFVVRNHAYLDQVRRLSTANIKSEYLVTEVSPSHLAVYKQESFSSKEEHDVDLTSQLENSPTSQLAVSKQEPSSELDLDLTSQFQESPTIKSEDCSKKAVKKHRKSEATKKKWAKRRDERVTGKFSPDYKPTYLVDEATWKMFLEKKLPWVCPKCQLESKALEYLILHWKRRVCTRRPGYAKFVGRKKMENSNISEFFCKHKSCAGSSEVWKNNIQVLRHWQLNHFIDVQEPVVCKVEGCGEQFVAEPLLTLHTANKHRNKDELYSCQHCGWTTNDKRTLLSHETRHSAKKTIACPYCDYMTNENKNLKEHQRRLHPAEIGYKPPERLNNVCDTCGKAFRSIGMLREHQASHSTVQNPDFRCDICGKYLKQQNSYSKHRMNVHKLGPSCEVCNKIFYSSKVLQIHRRDKHGLSITNFI